MTMALIDSAFDKEESVRKSISNALFELGRKQCELVLRSVTPLYFKLHLLVIVASARCIFSLLCSTYLPSFHLYFLTVFHLYLRYSLFLSLLNSLFLPPYPLSILPFLSPSPSPLSPPCSGERGRGLKRVGRPH